MTTLVAISDQSDTTLWGVKEWAIVLTVAAVVGLVLRKKA